MTMYEFYKSYLELYYTFAKLNAVDKLTFFNALKSTLAYIDVHRI